MIGNKQPAPASWNSFGAADPVPQPEREDDSQQALKREPDGIAAGGVREVGTGRRRPVCLRSGGGMTG